MTTPAASFVRQCDDDRRREGRCSMLIAPSAVLQSRQHRRRERWH